MSNNSPNNNNNNNTLHPIQLEIFVDDKMYPDLYELYRTHIDSHNRLIATTAYPNAGFDLFLPEDVSFQNAHESKLVNLGVKTQMFCQGNPTGYYLYLRSSVYKTPLMLNNHVGVIDSGYRGNIHCALRYLPDTTFVPPSPDSTHHYSIEKYTRLVQICHPSLQPIYVKLLNSENELSKTERGHQGLGSTGLKNAIQR